MEGFDLIFSWVKSVLKFLGSIEILIAMVIITIIVHLILILVRDNRYLKTLKRYQDPKKVNIEDLNDYPIVTILIPAWNERDTFKECLNSCSKLTYPKLKIIVNAGGSEKTLKIANGFKEDNRFLILTQSKGRGKIAALNDCLNHISEGLVYMVDADVVFEEEVLLRMIQPIINLGEKVVVGGHKPLEYQKNKDIVKYHKLNRFYFFRFKFNRYKESSVSGANTVVTYDVIKSIGKFTITKNWAEDLVRGLDIVSKGFKIYKLTSYRGHIYSILPDDIKTWVRQKIRWNENARIYSFEKNLKKTILKVIIITLFGIYLMSFPLLFLINLGFVSLGIFILSNLYLIKIRRLIFFNRFVEKKFQISIDFLFLLKILFYIYVEAFVHVYIAVELLIFGGKKLRERKNI